MPERLGDLLLVGTLEGSDAMARVNQLHGTDIELVNAYIAEYARASNSNRNGDEWLTVWVGGTESTDAAADLMRRMTEGIERGGSGFSNLQRLTISGHEVLRVAGPGGQHFFYISREQRESVVWLILEAHDALPILEQAVQDF